MNFAVIKKLYPQVTCTIDEVAYDESHNVIEYDKAAVQAYVDAHVYQDNRAAEYPSFADQFDTLYHGGYDAWKAQIDAIKLKYPKP